MSSTQTSLKAALFRAGAPVVALALMFALLAACSARVQQQQEAYWQRTRALQSQDPRQILAGRKAEDVLVRSVAAFSCTWPEKGILFPSYRSKVVTDAVYDSVKRQLFVRYYYDYGWGPGTTHRTTSEVVIPLAGMEVWIMPPDIEVTSFHCWRVEFKGPDNQSIQIHNRRQLIGSSSVTEKGEAQEPSRYLMLKCQQREPAVDAWAALKVLIEEATEAEEN